MVTRREKNRAQDSSKKWGPVNVPDSQSGYVEGYTLGLWGQMGLRSTKLTHTEIHSQLSSVLD